MKTVVYFIAVITALSIFYACDNDDNFSTSSEMRLYFEKDTLSFDTVFTTIGTATRRLKVYNNNSDALTIGSIELMNPKNTGFRMNVDGQSGDKISNVDLLGKDSLYIFVEVTVDPLNQNNPLLISDSIRFLFNGLTQYIRLEAIGQDAVIWKAKAIVKDTTLTGEKPFLIYDYLKIEKGATLTIEKNARLHFHHNTVMNVEGRINAVGTVNEPIVFRGDRLDNLFENPPLPYDRIPGQWYGIKIASDSYENRFENVRIRNGEYGVYIEPSDTTKTKVTFMNTVIQNTTKGVLYSVNAKIDARNSLFANSGEYTVNLFGGSYDFLHCTITNYMSQNDINGKGVLFLSNNNITVDGKDYTNALVTCRFINTIVSGRNRSSSDVNLDKAEGRTFNYQFINCLINLPGSDDNNFMNTVWNVSPEFYYIYASEDRYTYPERFFYYNFQLTENSPARNKASRTYAAELPEDINGTSRRSDEAPDIGCFEFRN